MSLRMYNEEVVLTQDQLCQEFIRIGIQPGDTLCVHSALSSFGLIIGGARTLVEALISAVGAQGAIMMPAYSGDNSDPAEWKRPAIPAGRVEEIRHQMPAFDVDKTPSRGVGGIPEYFRTYPGVMRSLHPQSSFCALGAHAEKISNGHQLDYRFGEQSPLARLLELNGKVVLLGAPWDTVSFFYLTEYSMPEQQREKRSACIMDSSGQKVWKEYEDLQYSCDWFEQAVEFLLEQGVATEHQIGNSKVILFSVAEAFEQVVQWRIENKIFTKPL